MGYEVEGKKARRTLTRHPFSKKSKIKENNDVDDKDDAVPLSISTTVTKSHPTVTCSTPYNWSATPLASFDHSYCMHEENMSLPSYSDLADEIKARKLKILKDKIKASKRSIKVLAQRHENFTWKKIKTDAKIRFYTGIASAALFNTIYTLIKPYIPHIMYWK